MQVISRSNIFLNSRSMRQRIIKTIVDKIRLNTNEGWFELEGVISGQFLFDDNNENDPNQGSNEQNIQGNGFRRISRNSSAQFASSRVRYGHVRLHVKSIIKFKGKSSFQFLSA